jgi:membrane-bound lytic murein transglycosylase B
VSRRSGALRPDELAAVLAFEGDAGTEHWLALPNFHVITRYNRSQNYALAVWQLAGEIRAARTGG